MVVGGVMMAKQKACKGCAWNSGVERIKNAFGLYESFRNCGYYGYLEMWRGLNSCKHFKEKDVSLTCRALVYTFGASRVNPLNLTKEV